MKDRAKYIFHRDVQDVLDLIGGGVLLWLLFVTALNAFYS